MKRFAPIAAVAVVSLLLAGCQSKRDICAQCAAYASYQPDRQELDNFWERLEVEQCLRALMTKTWWLRSTSFTSFTRMNQPDGEVAQLGDQVAAAVGVQDSLHLPRDAQLWCNGSAASTLITYVTHCVGRALTPGALASVFSPLTNSGSDGPKLQGFDPQPDEPRVQTRNGSAGSE